MEKKVKMTAAAKITRIVFDILFAIGLAFLVALPFILPLVYQSGLKLYVPPLFDFGLSLKEDFYILMAFMYVVDIVFIIMVWDAGRIYRRLEKGLTFDRRNVNALRRIALFSLIMALLFFAKTFYYGSYWTLFIAFVCFMIGLFSKVLQDVFRRAAEAKEENDLTI
jgi:hypothetical protein